MTGKQKERTGDKLRKDWEAIRNDSEQHKKPLWFSTALFVCSVPLHFCTPKDGFQSFSEHHCFYMSITFQLILPAPFPLQWRQAPWAYARDRFQNPPLLRHHRWFAGFAHSSWVLVAESECFRRTNFLEKMLLHLGVSGPFPEASLDRVFELLEIIAHLFKKNR